jgi:hypothetical protein
MGVIEAIIEEKSDKYQIASNKELIRGEIKNQISKACPVLDTGSKPQIKSKK